MEFTDLRIPAAITLIGTLVGNTYVTWNHLPYFPIEFSQMGWGVPGAAGGYYIMSWGMCIAASFMLRMHVEERSALGVVGAVLMALLGLVNGNDVPVLQIAHGIIAASCFAVYIIYVYVNIGPFTWAVDAGLYALPLNIGPFLWLIVALVALIVGHAIVLTQLDVRTPLYAMLARVWTEAQAKHPEWILSEWFLRFKMMFFDTAASLADGFQQWPRVWAETQAKHPMWINQFKALCQHTMLVAFFVSVFSIPPHKAKSA